jgi:glycosyltransferase involved in cell wall biosynthesis
MNRDVLIRHYKESDFLFLHLNDYEAFKKVLPSKIFEYGATRKPIIAGVDGYARNFLEENLQDSLIFEPSNVEDFIQVLENYKPSPILREDFIRKFNREVIFDEMTDTIIKLIVLKEQRTV